MTCIHCNKENKISQKLGRCHRCMIQLAILSVIGWALWWGLLKESPKSINSIALVMANLAFNGLLVLHLLMKFIFIPLSKPKRRSNRR
ncbi:DUF3624 domain-containing protein [Vibrio makurazakiensis]|uniref:DUF3624 domain-containing protein n=1 Tax=Vibrio makurazakiensis TaxID=2910250 RepID=UPI003D0FBBB3